MSQPATRSAALTRLRGEHVGPMESAQIRDNIGHAPSSEPINEDHLPPAWRSLPTPTFAKAQPKSHSDTTALFWGVLMMMREMALAPFDDIAWLWSNRVVVAQAVLSLVVPFVASAFIVNTTAAQLTQWQQVGAFVLFAVLTFMATGWLFSIVRLGVQGLKTARQTCINRGHDWLQNGG